MDSSNSVQLIDFDDSISLQNQSFMSISDKQNIIEEQLRKSNESVSKLRNAYGQLKNQYLLKVKQNEELKNLLNQQMEEQPKNIEQILACITVDSVDWILCKTDTDIEWQRRKEIQINVDILDYNQHVKEKLDLKKKKENFQEELQQVIKQYESRNLKIQQLYEENELKICEIQEKNKLLQLQNTANQQKLTKIIDESETILQNCLIFNSEDSDQNTKNECKKKMNYLINNLEQMQMDQKFNTFKEHLLILHKNVFEVMKKSGQIYQELIEIEVTLLIRNLSIIKQICLLQKNKKNKN